MSTFVCFRNPNWSIDWLRGLVSYLYLELADVLTSAVFFGSLGVGNITSRRLFFHEFRKLNNQVCERTEYELLKFGMFYQTSDFASGHDYKNK